jgi:hypothetical protein
MSSQNNAISLMQMESTLTCPRCGHQSAEQMPTNACQFFYVCKGCGEKLKPLPGDCYVFCSYGTVPCPPVQTAAHSSARRSSSGKTMVNGLPMPSARPQRLAAQRTARSLRAAITWSAMVDCTITGRDGTSSGKARPALGPAFPRPGGLGATAPADVKRGLRNAKADAL